MDQPRLTFFCELERDALQNLFADPAVVEDLLALKARLSLGILDLSPERAQVVRRLNQAGIPLTAWLLLPSEQGYWFNIDNALQAEARYQEFKAWTEEYSLRWTAIGLDIEPDVREMRQWNTQKWRLLAKMIRRAFDRKRLVRAQANYVRLVRTIRRDGYGVESYQFPLIADERKVKSTLLRRVTGVVDIPADREVWMLYTSFLRPSGSGVLWSYASEAPGIGLGSAGGGIEVGIGDSRPMTWDELARDLRLAWYWKNDLYIFSLEGCLRQGFMERLKAFEWDQPILFPEEVAGSVERWRGTLQAALWLSKNAVAILIGLLVSLWAITRLREFVRMKYRQV